MSEGEELTEEQVGEISKALFQLNSEFDSQLQVFNMHGMGIYIPQVTTNLVKASWLFAHRLQGFDIPIIADYLDDKGGNDKN